jgi:hypothetical protein
MRRSANVEAVRRSKIETGATRWTCPTSFDFAPTPFTPPPRQTILGFSRAEPWRAHEACSRARASRTTLDSECAVPCTPRSKLGKVPKGLESLERAASIKPVMLVTVLSWVSAGRHIRVSDKTGGFFA